MKEDVDAELFNIVTYLVGAASNCPGETLALASFRLLDAATRLITMAEQTDAFTADPFLLELRRDILAHQNDVMWDQPAFLDWLPDLESKTVAETRRRNLAAQG